MSNPGCRPQISALRATIARLESAARVTRAVLPFGLPALDARLPGGGLALGALHEISGGGAGVVDGAAAALFAAGIAAQLTGPVLWCLSEPDLFAPALAQAGLDPDRVLHVEAGSQAALLACFEEGLRHGGLAAVVGEVARLPLAASRRLQLAAEAGGTLALALRRWRRATDAAAAEPNAAVTRWRVTTLPSAPLPVPGVGRARWQLELLRARGGDPFTLVVESSDATGHLALAADLADRPAASRGASVRAAA